MEINLEEIKKVCLSSDVEREIGLFCLGKERQEFLARVEETLERRLKEENITKLWMKACSYGLVQTVKILLQRPFNFETEHYFEFFLRIAASRDHTAVVKLLLADSRFNSQLNDWVLRAAVQNGHEEVVKLLLSNPRIDPSVRTNSPLRLAYACGHTEIVDLLLSHPKVDPRLIEGRTAPDGSFCPVKEINY